MSSTIASVSRNRRAADGIRRPSTPSTPTAKAMSVAIGIPQPAAAVAAGRVEGEVERGRHHHPADRGHDRQRGGPGVAQVAVDQLVLDLQPDHEEEDHHQRVVDPVLQRLVEVQRPGVQDDVGVPERVVRRRPRAVGPDQRDGRGEQQQQRARRLDAQELAHRSRDEAGQRLVARHVGRAGLPEVVADARVVVRVVGSRGHAVADPSGIVEHSITASTRRGPTRLPGSPEAASVDQTRW